ncbi:Di-copper centre-containing protein [Bimuria novae-zelandiae CBS 107.79]|uniref:Di-copper centre-containing protein n=1 Tax=Bimuria novae-zelandiae CBS 107.79 TaxID=1447943 RepID=A0A6A5UW98_9PLEO|nr:Di-copper centre-containing protein [Bimuria novae-zelandiae CBS 107.79]
MIALPALLVGTTGALFMENDALVAQGVFKLGLYIAEHGYPNPQSCTKANMSIRREWSTFSRPDKLHFIDSMKCLATRPARTPAAIAAGAKTRYDDFVVAHIRQTQHIHFSGLFLAWHRYFIWALEQTLRNECGYQNYLPYVNWPWWTRDPLNSPIFDGSDTSLSGNGVYIGGRNASCLPTSENCVYVIYPGTGGGCVTSGPFQNWTVNLGPIQETWPTTASNPQADGLGYNPRCLTRDINLQAIGDGTDDLVVSLINDAKSIGELQNRIQSSTNTRIGIHGSGHFGIGGAAIDVYNSPADPAFYLHHGMIDRIWTTWQNMDLNNRQFVVSDTLTLNNVPPSRNATLEDLLDLEFIGLPNITIADAVSTVAGPFCYLYA